MCFLSLSCPLTSYFSHFNNDPFDQSCQRARSDLSAICATSRCRYYPACCVPHSEPHFHSIIGVPRMLMELAAQCCGENPRIHLANCLLHESRCRQVSPTGLQESVLYSSPLSDCTGKTEVSPQYQYGRPFNYTLKEDLFLRKFNKQQPNPSIRCVPWLSTTGVQTGFGKSGSCT